MRYKLIWNSFASILKTAWGPICAMALMSHTTFAAPRILGIVSDSATLEVKQERDFVLNGSNNAALIKKVLGKLPYVKSAQIVSAEKYTKDSEYRNTLDKTYNYTVFKRNLMVSVEFERSALFPTAIFEVSETYQDCTEAENVNCTENVEFRTLGPKKLVSLHNDFTAFKSGQLYKSFEASVKFDNSATESAAKILWTFNSKGLGLASLFHFLSQKSIISAIPTTTGAYLAFNVWAANVSDSVSIK